MSTRTGRGARGGGRVPTGSITAGTPMRDRRRASSPLRSALSPSQLAQLQALHMQALRLQQPQQHLAVDDADTAA